MKIESGKTYRVEKYTAKTDWMDYGRLDGDDVKSIIKTFAYDKEMSELMGEHIYSRKNTTTMICVKEI